MQKLLTTDSLLWHSQLMSDVRLSNNVRDWIEDTSSLTQRLQMFNFARHELQFEGWQTTTENTIWQREIYWRFAEKIAIYAQALIPEKTFYQLFKKPIGTKSLGVKLFKEIPFQRTSFEFVSLQKYEATTYPTIARRSKFLYGENSLTVIEVFLPEFMATIEQLKLN